MEKSKLTILILILVVAIAVVGYLFLVSKGGPELSYYSKEAEKLAPYTAHYESSRLPNENKVISAKGLSPHALTTLPYISFNSYRDFAKQVCKQSGKYHLITMKEWGIIAQAAKEKGEMPLGNNDYGASVENPEETCEKDPLADIKGKCLCGTGPSTWCFEGICDLNGNLAEWVDFPDVIDGIVTLDGKEFTLVPANYDMEKVLTKEGVENLITEDIDPNPNEEYISGASVMIDTESEEYDYPNIIPIRKDTVLGDFDQFRNGDGEKYGDGKYYFWVPTYDRNGNGIEDGVGYNDWGSEILVCSIFNGREFTECENYRGCQLKNNNIREDQRISSVIPSLIRPKLEYFGTEYDCPDTLQTRVLHQKGFITLLREETGLKDLAIPASISEIPSGEFSSDGYFIAPWGIRSAHRGGSFKDGIHSGVFNLNILIDERQIDSWYIGYRCMKDTIFTEAEISPTEFSTKLESSSSTWLKIFSNKANVNEILHSITVTKDQNYLCGGIRWVSSEVGGHDIIINKIDSNGNPLWTKLIKEKYDNFLFSVQEDKDGNYMGIGWTNSFSLENKNQALLFKLNPGGKMLWAKTYGNENGSILVDLAESYENGYIALGTIFNSKEKNRDFLVMELNTEGEILWAKSFANPGYFDFPYSIIKTSDGGYLIGGKSADADGGEIFGIEHYFEDEKSVLIKIDSNGKILWSKIFNGEFGKSRIYSVNETSEDNYLLTGETYTPGEDFKSNIYLAKISTDGEMQWGKMLGIDQFTHGLSVLENKDRDYVVVGKTASRVGGLRGVFDPVLLKFDSGGNLLISKILKTTANEIFFSIDETVDGNYVLGGKSNSFSKKGDDDMTLLKLDKNGEVNNCPFLENLEASQISLSNFSFLVEPETEIEENSISLRDKNVSFSIEDYPLHPGFVCPQQ